MKIVYVLMFVKIWTWAQFAHAGSKTILDLQENMEVQSIAIAGGKGKLELINLNKDVNVWYLFRVYAPGTAIPVDFHLESPVSFHQTVRLDKDFPEGVLIERETGAEKCSLAKGGTPQDLLQKKKTMAAFASLCEGMLFMRNEVQGDQTTKEWAVEFLRENIWGGETVTSLVKNTLFRDKFALKAAPISSNTAEAETTTVPMPANALIKPEFSHNKLKPAQMGIQLQSPAPNGLTTGHWYPAKDDEGIFFSVLRPIDIRQDILNSYRDRVRDLDTTENTNLVYLVAIDMTFFDAGFSLGTEHPKLKWSERALSEFKMGGSPGPDGIDEASPLVRTGVISPVLRDKVSITFTGGFKRTHGAFHWGPLARMNNSSHYGFVEEGTVFSKLQPGLATAVIDTKGNFTIRTWQKADTIASQNVRFARQNGFPIIEFDEKFKASIPTPQVGDGLKGNWSADYFSVQRTLRAGVCSVRKNDRDFLIYGYFSSATANTMARVFQAYQCDYAMHLDMNLLEHTYLARYVSDGKGRKPEHLIKGMSTIDDRHQGKLPRFIAYPDNRDFFYLMRK